MPKKLLLSFALLVITSISQGQTAYRYLLDLTQINNDRLLIKLTVPELNKDELVLSFPKMVPGIYANLDFGRCITALQALDKQGQIMLTERLDSNSWRISNAKALQSISYEVDDDFENFASYEGLSYKSPRSLFTKDSVFILNTNSLFAYFREAENLPLQIGLVKHEQLYAASSLKKLKENTTQVLFQAADYRQLVDNPILIAPADTASFYLDEVKINVACYSTSGKAIAASLAKHLEPLIKAQKAYLGNKLPVSEYTFLLYHHASSDYNSIFFDGLEHSQSTLILLNMPLDEKMINTSVYGVASHEFFHTILPLAIHSEEIGNFDFSGPSMSKHLWLYEGMTEYFTVHMPIKQGLIGLSEFLASINKKVATMKAMKNDISLAELGRKSIERQDEYLNAYNRGTLLSLCLDIELRAGSNGAYGVQSLINDLQQSYGPNKSFKDDDLFRIIAQASKQPAIQKFLSKYVDQNELPPLAESLLKVGFLYENGQITSLEKVSKAQLALRKAWIGI